MNKDYIEAALTYAATGIKTDDAPALIYDAIDGLRKTPDKFLTWYANTVEFNRAKMQRTTQHQTTEPKDLEY